MRLTRLFALLAFVCIFILANIVSGYQSSNDGAARFLPTTIGGYKVIATFPPGAIACAPSNTTQIVLQSMEPNVRNILGNSWANSAHEELKRFKAQGIITDYQIALVGPHTTVEKLMQNTMRWNSTIAHSRCVKLGPAAIGSSGDEYNSTSSTAGRTLFENITANDYPSGSDYDNGQ